MTQSFPFSHRRLPYLRILTTVLVTVALLCAGMRVPTLSRPHRPKPMHRVVLKAQVTKAPSHAKQQHHDFFVSLPQLLEPAEPVFRHAAACGAPAQHTSPSPVPNSGRSPPAMQQA